MQVQAIAPKAPRAPRKATKLAQQVEVQALTKQDSSPIASLESRTTPAAATAPVAAGMRTGASVNFSGQYLYDRFVNSASNEDVAKMDIVRQMVKTLDVQTFKSNVGEMVKIAREFDKTDKSHFSAARLKTAMNHQSVMRNAYGAMRFASEAMSEAGVNDATGYHVVNTVAMRVLKEKGIKWDGTKAEDADVRAARLAAKQESKIMADVMAANPKRSDESREAYYARIDGLVTEAEAQVEAESKAARLEKLAAKVRELAGDDLSDLLASLTA